MKRVKALRLLGEAARAITMIPLFVLPFALLVVLASSTSGDQHLYEIVTVFRPTINQDWGRARSLSDVAETWWDAGGIFACLDTDSFSARCQNREEHSTLAIHTAEFVHVLVLLAAGLALCFGGVLT
jgi:hypothetical protein